MHATAKKVSLAKIRRRVGENSNEMLKRRPVASIIDEKVKFDKNGKSGENDAFGANICQRAGENSVVKITRWSSLFFSVIWIFYKDMKFHVFKLHGDFYSRASNFACEVKDHGYLTFTYENQKFGVGMVRAIPFEKLQKIWTVIWSNAIFLLSLGPVYMKVTPGRWGNMRRVASPNM